MVAGSPIIPIMSPPSHDGHSDDDGGRDRQTLPSFAQAFPSSPPITRPQLRNALSETPAAASSSAMPPATEPQKRKRDDDSLSIKNEDNEVDKLPEEPVSGPSKRHRSKKDSTSLSPPQSLHPKQGLPRSKHTLSGHTALLNETVPIASSSKTLIQTLPSTGSFSVRRAALSTSSSRKGAPSSLSINPPVQNSRKARELGLEPTIRSAPPVPASRLRLHQLQSASQPHVFQQSAGGGVPNISKVRFGATYETSPNPPRIPQPPKTAGLMGSSTHTSGGGGVQTVLQPPTPSTAGSLSRGRDFNPMPLVPPTPSSLRHTLNQTHAPRQPLTQANISTPAIAEGRSGIHVLHSNAKQLFLQPFEAFYDSLTDARSLKEWLSDALNRASTLLQQQQQQVAGVSPNTRLIEEIVDNRLRGHRAEVDRLRERLSQLEDALVRNGVAIPPTGTMSGVTSLPSSSLSRSNGSITQRSPGNQRDRELPIPSNSGGNLREPHSQHLRPSSSSPSAQQTVLPSASSLTKMSTSSSRLDPIPSRTQLPPVARSGRVPSPLGGSPISEGEERCENRESNRKGHEDKEDKMDTT